jgi:tetratricopeptide (TPR) repeat protein
MSIKRIIVLSLLLMCSLVSSAQYNYDTFLTAAKKDINDGRFADAITKLNICIESKPGSCEAYFYRGACKYSLFDNEGAERDYTIALSNFSAIFYEAYHYRSLVRYKLQNFQGAVDDITRAIEKQPGRAVLYVERSFSLLAMYDFKGAIKDCNMAITLNYPGEDPYLCRGSAEDALADFEHALTDFNKAITLNKQNSESFVRRGMTYFKLEKYPEALSDYNLALAIDSSYTFAYYNRAVVREKLNDQKGALSDYNSILVYEPRNAFAYFNRAVLYANMNQNKKSIADFDHVLLISPDNIQALFNRAKIKEADKDDKGAIADYDRITQLYPYFMEAYYNRAKIKYRLKDAAGAKKDFETGKLMSEVFRAKSNEQLKGDSTQLVGLMQLNGGFGNTSLSVDTVDIGFQPLFYIAERDSSDKVSFLNSAILDKINNEHSRYYFTNRPNDPAAAYNAVPGEAFKNEKGQKGRNQQAALREAIRNSNLELVNEAGELLDKIIAADSTNALAYFERGLNTCRKMELTGNVNTTYIGSNSFNSIAQNQRTAALQSALTDFSRAARNARGFAFAYFNRAYVKCLLKDFEGALTDYEAAIKINPGFGEASYNEAVVLFYMNQTEPACQYFSKAGQAGVSAAYVMMRKYCQK